MLSVIIPNYNHSKYLPSLIESILAQEFQQLEIIIIDDCSTDNSVDVIEKIILDSKLFVFLKNSNNQGVVSTANRGASIASGKYIYFAAADDIILPGFFKESIEMLENNKNAGLCSALSKTINPAGQTACINPYFPMSFKSYIPPDQCRKFLRENGTWMMGTSTIFKKEVFLECGSLNESFGPLSDVLIEMIISVKYGVCFIPTLYSYQRLISNSYSAQIAQDTDKLISYVNVVSTIMTKNYSHLFDSDFINYWKEREILFCKLSDFKRSIIKLSKSACRIFNFNRYFIFFCLIPLIFIVILITLLFRFKSFLFILKRYIKSIVSDEN